VVLARFYLKEEKVTDLHEPIEHRTRHYVNMVTEGVSAWQLRGKYIPGYVWTMIGEISGYLTRERAKEIMKTYLIETHQATEITFFRRASDKDNVFRVNFKRGDY